MYLDDFLSYLSNNLNDNNVYRHQYIVKHCYFPNKSRIYHTLVENNIELEMQPIFEFPFEITAHFRFHL